ncbi:MAG: acyl-CoA dehydrogenase family protein, partial [Chloroflexi bacterium]|nr:acyl-CoA dehydrogenase family protein [Chloroflexota bacterium]
MVQTEAEAAAAKAATAPAAAAVNFSMELNDEQRQMQKWVHDFAKDVIRPVAHEWDEREETPWPVIEEAAKVGI